MCWGIGNTFNPLVPNEIFPIWDLLIKITLSFFELKTDLVGPNSVDPEEMPQVATSLLDQHCLSLKILFWRSDGDKWVKLLYFDKKNEDIR